MTRSTKEVIGGAIIGVVALGIGFFAGQEYVKYQIRNAFGEAFAGLTESQQPAAESDSSAGADTAHNNDADTATAGSDKIGFDVTDKAFVEGDFQDNIAFTVTLTNKTEKDINGVKGVVTFRDMFGDQIQRVQLSYDQAIEAGASKEYRAAIDYNQFMDEDIKLRNTDLSRLQHNFAVSSIVYADGTQEDF